MASNQGKFIDRSPIICPAGKVFGDNLTVQQCLNIYKLQDKVDAVQHEHGIGERREDVRCRQAPLKNIRHCGIYTGVHALLCPPSKTRFQTLIDDLKETSYDSYWNKTVGTTRDPTPGLPEGMPPMATTFGKKTVLDMPAKEIVNPSKGVYQVQWEGQVGHEMYRKTHDDYNPGEQIDRKYLKPAFNPNKRFGMRTHQDPRGLGMKCCTHWFKTNPESCGSSIQSDYEARSEFPLGKTLRRFEDPIPDCRLGKPNDRGMMSMKDLLRDPRCEPNMFRREFEEWFMYLNKLRNYLKRRRNQFDFSFIDFKQLKKFKELTGYIPIDLFYELCDCCGVKYDHKCLEPLLLFIGVLNDGMINYQAFIELADINVSLPEIVKIEDVPKESQYYTSSLQAAACDYLFLDNSKKPVAGISTKNEEPKSEKDNNVC